MLRSRMIWICALTAAFCGPARPAGAEVVWSVDPARSAVALAASELVVAKVAGTIPVASGEIVTPGGTQAPSRVDVVLQAAALTTHDAKRDADLRSDHFFDVARYPQITFDARASGVHNDASGKRRVHYDAVGRFRRSDYGMTYARGVVGNVVKLTVAIEAVD